jgi:putative peptide zinc metalloprotease protein
VRRLIVLALSLSLIGLGGAAPASAQTSPAPAPAQPAPAPAQPAPAQPQPAQQAQPAPAAPAPLVDDKAFDHAEDSVQGGAHNIVYLENRVDNRLLMRGRVDLTHVDGLNASPVNSAQALASCTGCSTFAVAFQVAFIRRDATTVAPENVAVALNVHCTGCTTSARAVQYVFQVDNPQMIPERDEALLQRIDQELQAIRQTPGITPQDANTRIDAVTTEFQDLAPSLNDQRQDTTAEDS